MKTKICVIGCGNFARRAHGPSYNLIRQVDSEVEYAACADMSAEKAASYAAAFGLPRHYSDWREMAAAEKPDGICVLTGVKDTARTANEVLSAGIPVLMEKPPGRNRAEIEQNMRLLANTLESFRVGVSGISYACGPTVTRYEITPLAASKSTGTPAMVAFNRRYSPILTQMLAILENECREPVEHVRCDFYRCERLDADFSTTSIHGIDALRHISGGRYVDARLDYQPLRRESPAANIFVNAHFDNGAYGVISFVPSSGATFERYTLNTRHWTLIAHTVPPGGGSEPPGKIEVFHNNFHLRDEAPSPSEFNQEAVYLAGYYGENAAFVERLRHGFPAVNDLEVSLDAVELADCIRNRRNDWARHA